MGECKIESSREKRANGNAAYTDNKPSVRGLKACLTSPGSHLLSAVVVNDEAGKLAALQ